MSMHKSGDEPNEAWLRGRSNPAPYGKSTHRGSNPLSGAELDEADRRRIEREVPPPYAPPPVSAKPGSRSQRKPRKTQKLEVGAPAERAPLWIVLMFTLLGLLIIGIIGLIILNCYFPDWPHRPQAQAEEVARVLEPVPTAPPPPLAPPPQQATAPVAAVKLMLKASLAGDTRTAYAQWDVEPDDIITVQRGMPVTLAEQTEEAASVGARVVPEDYSFRLLSQSNGEAQVGQYKNQVLTQVYSLRRVGKYWKLYNTTHP